MNSKEYGSDFHYLNCGKFRTHWDKPNFFPVFPYLYCSGRAALYNIIKNGIQRFAWKKLYVPSYYCHEVYDFIQPLSIEIDYYQYHPFLTDSDFFFQDRTDHVVLLVNYFGIDLLDVSRYENLTTIEDVTHNLLASQTSSANYVFGSLRKVLPVPVGGFAKANDSSELSLPPSSLEAEDQALQKLTAMYLKRQYLAEGLDVKPLFRSLYSDGEQAFSENWANCALPEIIKPYLYSLDVEKIVEAKRTNAKTIRGLLGDNHLFEVISNPWFDEFGCILRFQSTEMRDRLKTYLLKNHIYPFVLWPNQISERDRMVADSLLFLHIDFRYNKEDMAYFAETINHFSSYA